MLDTPPTQSANDTPDPAIARVERRLRLLEEMSEIGMRLLRKLESGEVGQGDKGKDPAEIFAPLSRAIRLTVTLEAKTDKELRDLKDGIVLTREARQAVSSVTYETAYREAFKERMVQVMGLVMSVMESESETREEFEGLYNALEERFKEDDAYNGFEHWPVRKTVERLCNDLDLHPDWSLWEDGGWIPGAMPDRPRYSPFHTPSRTPILNKDGSPIVRAPPVPADHDLE